ncbi:MAG: substrate-binding domain-containing protein [Caldilineaceae bacterium]
MSGRLSRRSFLKQGAVAATGLGALWLAACAPAAPSTGGQSGAPAAAGGAPVPALLRAGGGEEKYFNQVIDIFEKQNPDTKINRIFVPGGQDYITKLDLMIASGDPPAIYAPFSNRGYRYYAAKGLSQELDDFATRDNLNLKDFHADGLKGCHWNGKLMALPLDLWPHVIFYNKTMFKEAGVDPLPTDWNDKTWTTDKYLEIAKKLTKREGDNVTQFGSNTYFTNWETGWALGGDWWPLNTYETGIIAEFTGDKDDKVINAMQWAADLMLKEKVAPTPAQAQQLQVGVSTPFFMSNKVAMEIGNIGSLSQYATIDKFEWGVAPAPFPPDGSPRHLHVWIDFWSMIKGVKNLEGSWKFLKFMVSADAQKIYPIEYGPQSALLSLGQYWIDKQKSTLSKLSADELKVMTEAPKYEQIDPENWTVNMSVVDSEALEPAIQKIWLGQGTAKDIITQAAADIRQKIDESKKVG